MQGNRKKIKRFGKKQAASPHTITSVNVMFLCPRPPHLQVLEVSVRDLTLQIRDLCLGVVVDLSCVPECENTQNSVVLCGRAWGGAGAAQASNVPSSRDGHGPTPGLGSLSHPPPLT